MEFARVQETDLPQQDAVRRLKRVLKHQGFNNITEIHASESHALVTAYNSQISSRALEIAPEAALLLTATFLVRQSGEGSRVAVLDPEILSVIPEGQELQSIIGDLRASIAKVLENINKLQQQNASDALADQVEEKMYGVILEALEAVSNEDIPQRSEHIFTLAKAYTAVASLTRTEEIELHLA